VQKINSSASVTVAGDQLSELLTMMKEFKEE
jgi:hypothetical protein